VNTQGCSWALQVKVDIEDLLLNGLAPSPVQVRQFAYWLSKLRNVSAERQKPMSIFNRATGQLPTEFVEKRDLDQGEFHSKGRDQYSETGISVAHRE